MSAPPGSPRPLAARVVEWGVLLMALFNLGRAVALQRQADWLFALSDTPDSRARMALALGWAALLLLSTLGLRRRWLLARRLVPLLLAFYGVYELGMIIAYSPIPPAVLPIAAYAAFVGFSGWALWRPATEHAAHPRQ
jgi:hypothetical protein